MIEQIISQKITLLHTPFLIKLMAFITFLGDKYFLAPISFILLIFLIYKKQYIKAKIFTLTMASAAMISQILKILIERTRPENILILKNGFSFPSGHATLSMAFFGMLIYLFKDKIKNKTQKYLFITINILLIIFISFSRIYLNAHWLTDVLAGLLIGLICIIGSVIIIKNKNK